MEYLNKHTSVFIPLLFILSLFFLICIESIKPKFIYKDGKAYKQNIFGIECINCCKEGKINAE